MSTIIKNKRVIARKDHKCSYTGILIPKKHYYYRLAVKDPEGFVTRKCCSYYYIFLDPSFKRVADKLPITKDLSNLFIFNRNYKRLLDLDNPHDLSPWTKVGKSFFKDINSARDIVNLYHKNKYGPKDYMFHLEDVFTASLFFKGCLMATNYKAIHMMSYKILKEICVLSFTHDLLEDTEVSEELISEYLGVSILNKTKALTKPKGYTRSELNKDIYNLYYRGIKMDLATTYVKIIDRYCNILYSCFNKNPNKLKMYYQEHNLFKEVFYEDWNKIIFNEIDNLFKKHHI